VLSVGVGNSLSLLAIIAALGCGPAAGQGAASDDAGMPHLLACTVQDTVHPTEDGTLATDPPLRPGTRAIGRVGEFVVDLATGVVRLPGLGNIAWLPAKGDQNSAELILTPDSNLESATSISIHIHRQTNVTWFMFVEADRVMTGTCNLLPAS
jgi:hypothetical protein